MADQAFEVLNYKKGAYITTEGQEELDKFYIIKQGRVERMAAQFLMSKNVRHKSEVLGVGDFFGVISCMARRPRIETVVALEDTAVILIKRESFGGLIQNNTAIALKIIRFFSRQLRYYDMILAMLISKSALKTHEVDDPNHLYQIGEYYFNKAQNKTSAAYAYYQYAVHKPNGTYVKNAKENLAKIPQNFLKVKPGREEHLFVYEDGQTIFLESEPGNELYVIREGKVKITKIYQDKEVLLDVLGLGDIFGEMAIIENRPRNANATASGTVKLMAITKENFGFVVKTYPDIATRIIEILSDRIWLVYRQITNMFISDKEIKLYDALYTQLLKHRVPIVRNASYVFEFTVEDLLKFTGMSGQDGKLIVYSIINNDKSLTVNPEGKFACSNISQIEQKLNVIKRNKEILQNMESSEYSTLLDNTAK